MASTLVQFRTDETEKIEAIEICEKLGFNLQAYLRMCIVRLIQEQGVPFSMRLEKDAANTGISALRRASQIAKERGISDMSLEEINNEIAEARK